MGQYLQFRSWFGTSSGAEKALAVTAATVVVALAAWAVMPTSGDSGLLASSGEAATTPGQTAGGGGSTAGPGTAPATNGGPAGTGGGVGLGQVPGGRAAGGTAGRPGATGQGSGGQGTTYGAAGTGRATTAGKCGPQQATEVGVTATTIRIAGVLTNLGGAFGNSAVGIASADQARKMSDAVVAEINGKGGIGCRKVSVTYFEVNPVDSTSAQNVCLQIVQQGFYAVIDMGGFAYPPGAVDCIPQHKIPIMAVLGPLPSERRDYGGLYMSLSDDQARASRTSILGMAKRGFFDKANGFKKLGIYMDDCTPEANAAVFGALADVGIKKGDISIYKFSCPGSGMGTQGSAAVLQHRQDGVTHVIPIVGNIRDYTTAAQQQGYHPKYTILDLLGQPIQATGSLGPDRDNFDGTVMVTTAKYGMATSGFSDAPTDACKALLKRHGVDPSWVTNGYLGGLYCNSWLVFAQAASKAPSLTRPNLSVGLGQLGHVPLAYTMQDADFRPGKYYGGDFWWPIQYRKSCNCWKVLDKHPQPSLG